MNNNALAQNKTHRIYLIGFFLILILPLLNIAPWFVPCGWGKSLVFRIILSILIFFFIYQLLSQGKEDKRSKVLLRGLAPLNRKSKIFWPFWLLIALGGIFLLATIFSLNPYFSFWGSPLRSGGSLNFSFYIIFAILAFLIYLAKDWRKIWDFTFVIGILICLIAIIQKFNLFSSIFVPGGWRSYSTLGGPTFLALYFLLLSFLAFSFGIKEIKKKSKKSLFYFLCFGLFAFGIFLAAGRAALLGLSVGFLFYIFFYSSKKILWLKIFTGLILILGILGVYWIANQGNQSELAQFLKENKFSAPIFQRTFPVEQEKFSFKDVVVGDSRLSTWKVSWQALKNRPILGYGPENFSIGYDKYYDPSLPGLENEAACWWDRAHNFIFDISVTAGIPALIIYLSFFIALFWQLQKIKKNKPIIVHGIQATLIGYLVANFFGFDIFSTHLIFFLIVGYSLYLISSSQIETINRNPQNQHKSTPNNPLWKSGLMFGLFCILIWFVWSGNLKPLKINKELNWADYYSTAENKTCQKSFDKMEEILDDRSIMDSYLRLKYIDIIGRCIRGRTPEEIAMLSQKSKEVLEEAIELRPYYTRSWFLLGGYTTTIIKNTPNLSPKVIAELKEQAYSYFEKANQLRPKSQMFYEELIKVDILTGEYEKAKEDSQKCLEIKSDYPNCWLLLGLANIYLGNQEEGREKIKKAESLGFVFDSEKKLLQIMEAYASVLNYQELINIYKQLLMLHNLPQYHASLATVYKEVGDYENARKEALIVLILTPEAKAEVEAFLDSLPE